MHGGDGSFPTPNPNNRSSSYTSFASNRGSASNTGSASKTGTSRNPIIIDPSDTGSDSKTGTSSNPSTPQFHEFTFSNPSVPHLFPQFTSILFPFELQFTGSTITPNHVVKGTDTWSLGNDYRGFGWFHPKLYMYVDSGQLHNPEKGGRYATFILKNWLVFWEEAKAKGYKPGMDPAVIDLGLIYDKDIEKWKDWINKANPRDNPYTIPIDYHTIKLMEDKYGKSP